MREIKDFVLSDSFEDMKGELGKDLDRMMDFFVPVIEAEHEISLITTAIKNTGKLLLMIGTPGVGKSTFIQSLKWRNHIPIREIYNINATDFSSEQSKLPQLLKTIKQVCTENDIRPTANGVYLFVVDYLESLEDETPEIKKAFFRDLNGIMRHYPIMVIWPVTEEIDIQDIINYSSAVSGTLFYHGREVINFEGPPKEKFQQIMKNTISVLNTGYTFNDFQLTDKDFDDLLMKLTKDKNQFTFRDYIFAVRQLWFERTGKIERILSSIPKPTEIWFVFSMPEAEHLVTQFIRKSQNIDDCWDAYHAKLDEYIHDNQKSAYWNSNRLQIAISGSFKAKIFFMPTNILVSSIAAFGTEFNVDSKIDWLSTGISKNWYYQSNAKNFLIKSPLIKQLKGEPVQFGATRSGVAKEAIIKATKAYEEINAISSKYNLKRDGSDKPFNKTMAKALKEVLPNYVIKPEVPHPWLTNIIPDITIEENDKIICLEFCYTKKSIPSTIADYVLNKLDNYMRQLEGMYPELLK